MDDDSFDKIDDGDNNFSELDHDDLDHDALNGVSLAVEPKEGESISNDESNVSILMFELDLSTSLLFKSFISR